MNSFLKMSKTKISGVWEFRKTVFFTDGGAQYCQICEIKIAPEKFHLNTTNEHNIILSFTAHYYLAAKKNLRSKYLAPNGLLTLPTVLINSKRFRIVRESGYLKHIIR